MKIFPDLMIRPDDYEVFSINCDNTYSSHSMKLKFPNSIYNKFSLEVLELHGFYPVFANPFVNQKDYIEYYTQKRYVNAERIVNEY